MPYKNENDPALPANVKKMDTAQRKKWVSVFNSAFEGCDGDDCEAEAMKQANGAMKESKAVSFEAQRQRISKALSEKHGGPGLEVYVVETFPDYVIAGFESHDAERGEYSRSYYQVPYVMDDTEIVFEDRANWLKVEPQKVWIEAKAGRRNNSNDAKMIQQMHDHSVSLGAACGEGKGIDEANHLKAISITDDEYRTGNYIILFEGRDLEGIGSPRKNADGSIGEYFTKSTALDSPYTEQNKVEVDWEHRKGELDDATLGYVDWSTKAVDSRGVFVERVLNRRNKYVKWIEALIEKGLIGTSTEPVQNLVKKAENGAIQTWPLFRDTLTVNPMEPRMLAEFGGNVLQAAKALGLIEDDEIANRIYLKKLQLKRMAI